MTSTEQARALHGMEVNDPVRSPSEAPDNGTMSPVPGRYTVIASASAILFIGVGFTNTFGVFGMPHKMQELMMSSLTYPRGVLCQPPSSG